MIKHRLISPLKKELEKGKNLIFFYGMKQSEVFYYDYIKGVHTASETFKIMSLEAKNEELFYSNKYMYINTNDISVFEKINKNIQNVTEQYFQIQQPKDDFDDMDDEENKGKTEEAKSTTTQIENTSSSLFENRLKLVEERIKRNEEKYFIFIDEFEWLANLYSSNKDLALNYIKYIKDWSKIKNVIIVVKITDIELIKGFDFDLENSSIFIGSPSSDEIQRTYLRKYLQETELESCKITDIINELKEIATSISSSKSNNNLKSAIRIYDNIVKQNPNYEINKRHFEIATEKLIEEKVTLDDVILNPNIKREILASVNNFLNDEENYSSRKGLILTGPPGTGKTFLVKAIANEKNCYFLAPTLAELKGEYIGQTSPKVKRLFEQARANEPTILFIDEADTVFQQRGGLNSDSFTNDLVNQFLVEIDGMKTGKQKVFVIAATNRVDILDSAVKSRLSEIITIGLPGHEERKELFHKKLLKYNFSFKEKSFQYEICKKTENMSGRDIDNFVKKLYEKVKDRYNQNNFEFLDDNEETKNLFLEILENLEVELINSLTRKLPVQILEPENIKTTFSDIIGYEKLKNEINTTLEYLKDTTENRKLRKDFGIENQYGILLYGPPGNAKTKLSEAVAKENELYYFKVLSKDFITNGNILGNIQLIFDEAKRLSKMTEKYKGVLLFFDEFDSLASVGNLDSVVRGTLLDYLANDNGGIRDENSKVVLMAATNFYEKLDEAVVRKGRIDKKLEMQNPTKENGIKMLEVFFNEDKNIKNPDSEIFNKIYEKLKNQKNKNISNGEVAEISIDGEIKIKRIEEKIPSGSDLRNIYKELKNIAFNIKSLENGKIIINDKVLGEVFNLDE